MLVCWQISKAYKTEINDRTGHEYISGVSLDGPKGIGGIGLAFDLGAVYKLNQDWTFSAAFTDIGFISWSNNMEASTNGVHTFNTDDYIFDPDDFGSTWDVMGDRLSALYELEDNGDTGRRNRALSATMNAGAEYVFPLYRPLSFGVLNTTRIAGRFSWTDFRLSAMSKNNHVPDRNIIADSRGIFHICLMFLPQFAPSIMEYTGLMI